MATLKISTSALASRSAQDDSTYLSLVGTISTWTSQRDALAGQVKTLVEDPVFHGSAVNELQARSLARQARALINEVVAAAG